MKEMEEVVRIFPQKLRALLFHAKTQTFAAEELRLRANRPLLMEAKGQEWRLRVDLGEWERVEVSASASALSGLNAGFAFALLTAGPVTIFLMTFL